MAFVTMRVRLVFTNRKAIRALQAVADCFDDVSEDMPWREDVKRAAKAAKYVLRHVRLESETGDVEGNLP